MLHYTAMDSAEAARDWLCNPESEVSAHYVIARDGTCWHLVSEDMRAWHAGAGTWGGIGDVNSRSIGIELANTGAEPFSEPQMTALEGLLEGILERWSIPASGVIGHSDFAPERKIDPGPRFDWRRLARRGLSIWPDVPQGGPGADWCEFAARFGYPVQEFSQEAVLAAFRARFRPGACGPVSDRDTALLSCLAHRFPFDGGRADT